MDSRGVQSLTIANKSVFKVKYNSCDLLKFYFMIFDLKSLTENIVEINI